MQPSKKRVALMAPTVAPAIRPALLLPGRLGTMVGYIGVVEEGVKVGTSPSAPFVLKEFQ